MENTTLPIETLVDTFLKGYLGKCIDYSTPDTDDEQYAAYKLLTPDNIANLGEVKAVVTPIVQTVRNWHTQKNDQEVDDLLEYLGDQVAVWSLDIYTSTMPVWMLEYVEPLDDKFIIIREDGRAYWT